MALVKHYCVCHGTIVTTLVRLSFNVSSCWARLAGEQWLDISQTLSYWSWYDRNHLSVASVTWMAGKQWHALVKHKLCYQFSLSNHKREKGT